MAEPPADRSEDPLLRTRIPVWVRPGSRTRRLEWDPWRRRWNVSVLAPAAGGRANRELLELLGRRLGVPVHQLEIVSGGSSHAKSVEVRGVGAVEAIQRLTEGRSPLGPVRPAEDTGRLGGG